MAKDCPDKPAETCRNCGEEGELQGVISFTVYYY